MRRLLVYSQGNGLGHIRRNRTIAKEILASEPDCSVLVIADCQATPFFPPLRGVDFLKVPSVTKSDNFRWHADMLAMNIEDTINLRSKIIMSAFRAFKPDVVLVDHRPVGVLGELKPMLERASSGPNPAEGRRMGLGHLRRTRNIAEQLLVRDPGSCILTLADSPVAPFFSPLPGMDYLKLPTIIKKGSNSRRTATLPLKIEDALNLRANVILQAFYEFNSDVVLVDHAPVGVHGELQKTLLWISKQRPPCKSILGFRAYSYARIRRT